MLRLEKNWGPITGKASEMRAAPLLSPIAGGLWARLERGLPGCGGPETLTTHRDKEDIRRLGLKSSCPNSRGA